MDLSDEVLFAVSLKGGGVCQVKKLAVVTRNYKYRGQVCAWGKVRVPWGWVLGPWSWEGGSAHGGGLHSQARSSLTVLCEPAESFYLNYNLDTTKFTQCKYTILWFFSTFTQPCNHRHNPAVERFHQPKSSLCPFSGNPHFYLPNSATTDLLCLYKLVFLEISYKEIIQYTIRVCVQKKNVYTF